MDTRSCRPRPYGFLVSWMAVLFVLTFALWSVGANTVERGYRVHGLVRHDRSISDVQLVSLDKARASLVREKRQSGSDTPPEASTNDGADTTPDGGNKQEATNPSGTSVPNKAEPTESSSTQKSAGSNEVTTVPPGDTNNNSNNNSSSSSSTNSEDNAANNNGDGTSTSSGNNANGAGDVLEEATQGGDSNPFADADVYHDYHKYYNSEVTNREVSQNWVELETATQHNNLSNSHRLAAVLPLKFPFYFYGHQVESVTVATGGFIYMSQFLHQWLTATQYVAPLMANFDTSLSPDSRIFYQSLEDRFTVEWKDVLLKDQQSAGKFHFQAILYKNNSIQFLYKKIPIPIEDISKARHPVRIGLSDAWYNDTFLQNNNVMRRTIIEYHKITVNTTLVRNGSAVLLHALPTCNRLTTCDTCTKHTNMSFDCKWCNIIGRCADGPDWYRQHWDKQGCNNDSVSSPGECLQTSTSTLATTTPRDVTTPSTTARMTTPSTTARMTSMTTRSTTPGVTIRPTSTDKSTRSTTTYKSSPFTTAPPKSTKPSPKTSIREQTTPRGVTSTTKRSTSDTTQKPPSTQSGTSRPSTSKPVPSPTPTPKPRSESSSIPAGTNPTEPTFDPNSKKDSATGQNAPFKKGCSGDNCSKSSSSDGFPVAGVVIIVLVMLALITAAGGWVYYAYTHPTSKSGMWLMEHRPSQMKAKIKFWKSSTSSGAKYQAESEA